MKGVEPEGNEREGERFLTRLAAGKGRKRARVLRDAEFFN